ncbi:hypothetical protein BK146_08470 [Paenibacillus sp. FSL R7-0333]|nr:hypothetical protein BK146_08470 [Paenibacillus sp. FSL R7-0333]
MGAPFRRGVYVRGGGFCAGSQEAAAPQQQVDKRILILRFLKDRGKQVEKLQLLVLVSATLAEMRSIKCCFSNSFPNRDLSFISKWRKSNYFLFPSPLSGSNPFNKKPPREYFIPKGGCNGRYFVLPALLQMQA